MLLALLTTVSHAGDYASDLGDPEGPSALRTETAVLAYDLVGFAPALPEQAAMGPDLLAAGGDGRLAAWDPVHHRVLVIDGLKTVSAFPVDGVDDLAVTAAGDVVIALGRTLILTDAAGTELARSEIPEIVPTQASFRMTGDLLVAVDAFDRPHPVTRIDGHSFALTDTSLGARITARVSAADKAGAIKASARTVGGWTIIERVVADHPIAVERFASIGGQRIALPVAGRAYVPARDLAVDAEGRLIVFEPEADGLHVVRISR